MRIFITHVGRIAFKALPILRMPFKAPSEVSIHLSVNKYMHIRVSVMGVVWANEILAGLIEGDWDLPQAREFASQHSMEIVGCISYEVYHI